MFALVRALESCPGYQARWVAEAAVRGWYLPIPAHGTCEHLRVQATERGSVSGCGHLEGGAAAWWQAAQGTGSGHDAPRQGPGRENLTP